MNYNQIEIAWIERRISNLEDEINNLLPDDIPELKDSIVLIRCTIDKIKQYKERIS